MFDHVTIRVADPAASTRFYRLALGDPLSEGEFVDWGELSLLQGAEPTARLHLGFLRYVGPLRIGIGAAFADRRGDGLGARLVADVIDDDVRPGGAEGQRDGPANARARAGHQRLLPGQWTRRRPFGQRIRRGGFAR